VTLNYACPQSLAGFVRDNGRLERDRFDQSVFQVEPQRVVLENLPGLARPFFPGESFVLTVNLLATVAHESNRVKDKSPKQRGQS